MNKELEEQVNTSRLNEQSIKKSLIQMLFDEKFRDKCSRENRVFETVLKITDDYFSKKWGNGKEQTVAFNVC